MTGEPGRPTGPSPQQEPGAPSGVEGPVAVVGLGLMGGSLARALRDLPDPPVVLGVDPDPVAGAQALDAGAVQSFDPDGSALLGDAQVVVYAAPPGVVPDLLATHRPHLGRDALLTDVSSLKGPVQRAAAEVALGGRFVGAHPMAGGEGRGFTASRSTLYRGARVWLTAGEEVAPGYRDRAESFWSALGGDPRWIDAEEHDRRMAWVSHLPQLVANALAGALDAAGFLPGDLGPGGRDMTRLAASSPELWRELLPHSAAVTGTGLTSVSRALNVLADLLARREVDRIAEFMERTREWSARTDTGG